MNNRYTVVSLFSGALGLDLGIERTGRFEVLACVEKEEAFRATIKLNRERGRIGSPGMLIYGDINTLEPQTLLADLGLKPGELDVLVGGPPCQAFSTAGRRRGIQDPRGTLLWRFLDFVRVLRPKAFLIENVRGIVSASISGSRARDCPAQKGSLLRAFVNDLTTLTGNAYRMDAFEVNSVNYGAPQIRERLICIGNRTDSLIDFPKPTHGARTWRRLRQGTLFDLNGSPAGGKLKPWATLRDAIADIKDPKPTLLDFSPRKKSYLSLVPPGSNWRSLPENVQIESMGRAFFAKGGRSGWWRRLTFDLPCPALVTMPNHASTSLCHPTETRVLSLRECARIQEFPDDWEFCGTTSEKYCQVGNAVPVRLGEVAGKAIAEYLDRLHSGTVKHRGERRERFRLVYLQSHIRTRRWYGDGEPLLWTEGGSEENPVYRPPVTIRKVTELKAGSRIVSKSIGVRGPTAPPPP